MNLVLTLTDPKGGFDAPPFAEWPDLGCYTDGDMRWYGSNADIILTLLLAADIAFVGNHDGVMGVFLNCNDIFAPAADAEPLPVPIGYVPRGHTMSENDEALLDLYRRVKAHGSWGAQTWIALRRKAGPWRVAIRERWIASGAWDPVIETFGVPIP